MKIAETFEKKSNLCHSAHFPRQSFKLSLFNHISEECSSFILWIHFLLRKSFLLLAATSAGRNINCKHYCSLLTLKNRTARGEKWPHHLLNTESFLLQRNVVQSSSWTLQKGLIKDVWLYCCFKNSAISFCLEQSG